MDLVDFFLLGFFARFKFSDDVGCILRLSHAFSIFFFGGFAIEDGRWSDFVGFI